MLQIQNRAAGNGARHAANCFSPIVNPPDSAVHRHSSLTLSCCPLVIRLNKWFGFERWFLRDTSSDPVPGLPGWPWCSWPRGTTALQLGPLAGQAWPEKKVPATGSPWDPGLVGRVLGENGISSLGADTQKPPVLSGSYRRAHALAFRLLNHFKVWHSWLCDNYVYYTFCFCFAPSLPGQDVTAYLKFLSSLSQTLEIMPLQKWVTSIYMCFFHGALELNSFSLPPLPKLMNLSVY